MWLPFRYKVWRPPCVLTPSRQLKHGVLLSRLVSPSQSHKGWQVPTNLTKAGKSCSISQSQASLSQNQTGLTQSHTLESLSQSHKDR